jgi:hypothetical protein
VPLEHDLSRASAEESVKNWLAFREKQKQLPAEKSLGNWVAYRESLSRSASPKRHAQEHSRAPRTAEKENQVGPATDKKSKRGPKNEAGL